MTREAILDLSPKIFAGDKNIEMEPSHRLKYWRASGEKWFGL